MKSGNGGSPDVTCGLETDVVACQQLIAMLKAKSWTGSKPAIESVTSEIEQSESE